MACLESGHSYAEALFLLARTERRLSFYQAAQGHLASYLRAGGEANLVELEGCLHEAQRGDLAANESVLLAYVAEDHPDSLIILEALVKGYIKAIRPDDALACLDKWLKRAPESGLAWFLHGKACQSRMDLGTALDSYRRSVELAPNNDAARMMLAEQLLRANKLSDALEHFHILREKVPDEGKVLLGMARAYFALGQLDEARLLLNTLLAHHPDHDPALVLLGRLEQSAQHPDKAEILFRKALDLAPYHREAVYALALCLTQQDKHQEAADWQKRLAIVDEALKQRNQFIADAARAPKDPYPLCEAGKLSLKLGKEGEGVPLLESALKRNPNYWPAHRALADYYRSIGQPVAAAVHEKAMRGK
jgi:tetratricopeptide (TPR) repeat protein